MPTSRVYISDTASRLYVRKAAIGPTVHDLAPYLVSDLAYYTVAQLGEVPASIVRLSSPASVVYAGLKGPTNTVEALRSYTVADLAPYTVDQLGDL